VVDSTIPGCSKSLLLSVGGSGGLVG
jgi:hypothetical protein